MFSYQSRAEQLDPFLLLDHADPYASMPGNEKCGIGEHPHRGLETVTIAYSGEVECRDLTGHDGIIGPGNARRMTVGTGILHGEFHSPEPTRQGDELEMVRLQVNLPAKDKMAVPGYQDVGSDVIPTVALPDEAGSVRAIAGSYQGTKDPAHIPSPLNVWDMCVQHNHQLTLSQPEGWSTVLVVLKGNITVNDTTSTSEAQLVVLNQQGKMPHIEASSNADVLLLSGEPLSEPIVGYGPFIVNTKQEIAEAVRDFSSDRFSQIWIEGEEYVQSYKL